MQRLLSSLPLALAFAVLLVLPQCWLIEDGLTESEDQNAELPPITAKQGAKLIDALAR